MHGCQASAFEALERDFQDPYLLCGYNLPHIYIYFLFFNTYILFLYVYKYIYIYIYILLYNLEFRVCSKGGFGSRGKQLEVSKDSFF